jgi:hypothetical protein
VTNLEDVEMYMDHSLTSMREHIHEYPRDVRAIELKTKIIELHNRIEELIKDRNGPSMH